MKKQPKIRWKEKDYEELRRITKNYNAKINRKRKELLGNEKRYDASQLPEKASFKELKKNIQTRAELNAELERMERYIKTEAKYKLDKRTEKYLDDTVEAFNKKIDKVRRDIKKKYTGADVTKRQGELTALPQKLNKKVLLKTIQTKEDLKQFLKEHREFLKDGAEEIVELPKSKFNLKMTKWQKEWTESKLELINKARDAERKAWDEAEVKFGGKSAGYTRAEVGMNKGDHDIRDMKLYSYSSTYTDIKDKINLMIREMQPGYWDARTNLAKFNYLDKLNSVMNNHSIGKLLYEHISNLDVNDFKRVLTSEDNLWLKLYELEQQDTEAGFLSALSEVWDEWFPDKDMFDEYEYFLSEGEWRL